MKKIANSCFWGTTVRAVSNKLGSLPISPKWTNFEFLQQFCVQNLNSKRVYFKEKSDISCIKGPMGWAVLVKCMFADQPNMGRSNLFEHFEFKIQNNFGSVLGKKLQWSKIDIVDVSRSAHGHRPKVFIINF